MLNPIEFKNRIRKLPKVIPSKTGKASYTGFRLDNNTLYFHRVNPDTNWSLDVMELYDVYTRNEFINTTVLKRETNGRVNSPSVAILMEIRCINGKGNRI